MILKHFWTHGTGQTSASLYAPIYDLHMYLLTHILHGSEILIMFCAYVLFVCVYSYGTYVDTMYVSMPALYIPAPYLCRTLALG